MDNLDIEGISDADNSGILLDSLSEGENIVINEINSLLESGRADLAIKVCGENDCDTGNPLFYEAAIICFQKSFDDYSLCSISVLNESENIYRIFNLSTKNSVINNILLTKAKIALKNGRAEAAMWYFDTFDLDIQDPAIQEYAAKCVNTYLHNYFSLEEAYKVYVTFNLSKRKIEFNDNLVKLFKELLNNGDFNNINFICNNFDIYPNVKIREFLLKYNVNENFDSFYNEIDLISGKVNLNGDITNQLSVLCDHIGSDELNKYPVVLSQERSSNIAQVNGFQQKWLNAKRSYIKIENPKSRALVLYFRDYESKDNGHEMNRLDFLVSAWVLEKYISEGRSQVFDNIVLVSRKPNLYPKSIHQLCPSIVYKNKKGESFKEACSVGANVIHYTHGTPVENRFASVPILSYAMWYSEERMEDVQKCVKLNLNLYKNDPYISMTSFEGEVDCSGSISGVIHEILRAVRECENVIIEEANSNDFPEYLI